MPTIDIGDIASNNFSSFAAELDALMQRIKHAKADGGQDHVIKLIIIAQLLEARTLIAGGTFDQSIAAGLQDAELIDELTRHGLEIRLH